MRVCPSPPPGRWNALLRSNVRATPAGVLLRPSIARDRARAPFGQSTVSELPVRSPSFEVSPVVERRAQRDPAELGPGDSTMVVIVICVLLALTGIVMVVRWGELGIRPPAVEVRDSSSRPGLVPRWFWYSVLVVCAGAVAGVLAAGAGGRLVMRLPGDNQPGFRSRADHRG